MAIHVFTILKIAAVLFFTVFTAGRHSGAEPPKLDDAIRQRAEAFVGKSPFLGIAVGVVDGDKVHAVCAGHRSIAGAAADDQTLFEIGSVTKTFTGLLLADAVMRGEMKLEQAVSELLGPDAKVPQIRGASDPAR